MDQDLQDLHALAELLDGLDRSHSVSLTEEQRAIVDRALAHAPSYDDPSVAGIQVPDKGRPTKPTGGASSLIGVDGNAFAVMGFTRAALKRAGASSAFVDAYTREATSGDYDHVIATSMAYLDSAPMGGEDPDDFEDDDEPECDHSDTRRCQGEGHAFGPSAMPS